MGIDDWLKAFLDKIDPTLRYILDGGAATISVGSFLLVDNMNFIVLALTGFWTFLRIWETETVRKWTGRLKEEEDNG